MSPEQIKSERNRIEAIINRRQLALDRVIRKQAKVSVALDRAKERLYELRAKCDHDFDREDAPTMMGRGTCIICGEDDY